MFKRKSVTDYTANFKYVANVGGISCGILYIPTSFVYPLTDKKMRSLNSPLVKSCYMAEIGDDIVVHLQHDNSIFRYEFDKKTGSMRTYIKEATYLLPRYVEGENEEEI